MISGIDPDFRRAVMLVGNSTSTNFSPVSYQVPYGARLLYVFGAGAGAGGGGGASGPLGTTRGGGGGTSTLSTVEAIIPVPLVPSTLLIEVGKGGIGGSADTAGTAGGLTRILMPQRNNRLGQQLLSILNLGGASPGQPGRTTAGGAGANFVTMGSNYPVFAIQNSLGGGGNGGLHTGGGTGNQGNSGSLFTSSTGGAGVGTNNVSFAGGSTITVRGTILGGTAANGFDGNDGYSSDPLDYTRPFVRNGATGGASNGTGTGGRGGNGGLSCSGAGGGGGVIGGAGGNGGDGFIILVPVF